MIVQHPPSRTDVWMLLVGRELIDSNECSYGRRSHHLSLTPDQNRISEWCYNPHTVWRFQTLGRMQKQSDNSSNLYGFSSRVCVRIHTKLADKVQPFVAIFYGLPLEAWVFQYVSTSFSLLWAADPVWIGDTWTIQPRERPWGWNKPLLNICKIWAEEPIYITSLYIYITTFVIGRISYCRILSNNVQTISQKTIQTWHLLLYWSEQKHGRYKLYIKYWNLCLTSWVCEPPVSPLCGREQGPTEIKKL